MENTACVLTDRSDLESDLATIQYACNQGGRWFIRKKEYNWRTEKSKWSKWREFNSQWIPGCLATGVISRVPSEKELKAALSGPSRKWLNTLAGEQFNHT